MMTAVRLMSFGDSVIDVNSREVAYLVRNKEASKKQSVEDKRGRPTGDVT
jgi:hypothetical protein